MCKNPVISILKQLTWTKKVNTCVATDELLQCTCWWTVAVLRSFSTHFVQLKNNSLVQDPEGSAKRKRCSSFVLSRPKLPAEGLPEEKDPVSCAIGLAEYLCGVSTTQTLRNRVHQRIGAFDWRPCAWRICVHVFAADGAAKQHAGQKRMMDSLFDWNHSLWSPWCVCTSWCLTSTRSFLQHRQLCEQSETKCARWKKYFKFPFGWQQSPRWSFLQAKRKFARQTISLAAIHNSPNTQVKYWPDVHPYLHKREVHMSCGGLGPWIADDCVCSQHLLGSDTHCQTQR